MRRYSPYNWKSISRVGMLWLATIERELSDRELMDRLLELRIKRLEQEIGRTN